MRALVVEISFSEAFFKVHYTKGFRLTYPIPLPTAVAGIFGTFLGIERKKLKEEFKDMLFGAKLVRYDGIVSENATYFQYKFGKTRPPERGTTQITIINNPTYLVALATKNKVKEIERKIKESIKYLPYGGQNDFFPLDWKISGIKEIEESDEITNYAPQDWVMNPILERDSEIRIIPVRHKLSKNPNFYFIINGGLKLDRCIQVVKSEKIGLYSLENFHIP